MWLIASDDLRHRHPTPKGPPESVAAEAGADVKAGLMGQLANPRHVVAGPPDDTGPLFLDRHTAATESATAGEAHPMDR